MKKVVSTLGIAFIGGLIALAATRFVYNQQNSFQQLNHPSSQTNFHLTGQKTTGSTPNE